MKKSYRTKYWPIDAKIERINGNTNLTVDGKAIMPQHLFGYGNKKEAWRFFDGIKYSADAGNNIYMMALGNDFGDPKIREYFVKSLEDVLEEDPDAYFLIRMSASAGDNWAYSLGRKDLNENQKRFDGGSNGWLSLASKHWKSRILANYTNGIEWLRRQKVAEHIIGFTVCNATSAEWVFVDLNNGETPDDYSRPMYIGFREWLAEKYKTDKALQNAWYDDKVTLDTAEIPTPTERAKTNDGYFHNTFKGSSKVVDFNTYYNELYADCIDYCAGILKKLTNYQTVTGVLYGYYFSYIRCCWPAATGAFALQKLLRSPNIDLICATQNYGDRSPGVTAINTIPIDSILLSGKMYIGEEDMRTCLTSKVLHGDREYRAPDMKTTIDLLRRNFTYSAIRDSGFYWMDMQGWGWYAAKEMWEAFAQMRSIHASTNLLPGHNGFSPDIALIVDEESIYNTKSASGSDAAFTNAQKEEIEIAGLSYGLYMKQDLKNLPDSVRVLILANCSVMKKDDIEALKRFKKDGRSIIFVRATGYINETSQSIKNIIDIVNINLKHTKTCPTGRTVITNFDDPATVNFEVPKFGCLGAPENVFYIDDKDAVALGVYEETDYVSFARKDMGNWTSIFSASGVIPASILRNIAVNLSGAHSYKYNKVNQYDGIETDHTLIGYNPKLPGRKIFPLKEYSHVVENFTHQNFGDSISNVDYVSNCAGEYRLFTVEPGQLKKISVSDITRTGNWKKTKDSLSTDVSGDTLEFDFDGPFLSLFADASPDMGRMSVEIDGIEYPFVSMKTNEKIKNGEFVLAQNMSNTTHHAKLTVIDSPIFNVKIQGLAESNPKGSSIYSDINENDITTLEFGENVPKTCGIRFTPRVNGKISEIKMYTLPEQKGSYTVSIIETFTFRKVVEPTEWKIKSGVKGWQSFKLKTPVDVNAKYDYVISITPNEDTFTPVIKNYYSEAKSEDFIYTYENSSVYGKAEYASYRQHSVPDCFLRDIVFTYDKDLKKLPETIGKKNLPVKINGFGTVEKTSKKITKKEYASIEKEALKLAHVPEERPYGYCAHEDYIAIDTINRGDGRTDLPLEIISLGTKFAVRKDGKITHVRIFSLERESGKHIVRLFDSETKECILGPIEWTFDSGVVGWRYLKLDKPFSIKAGKDYVISVSSPITGSGGACSIDRYFANVIRHDDDMVITYPDSSLFIEDLEKYPPCHFNCRTYLRDIVFVPDDEE